MCAEILHLGKIVEETPNRKFFEKHFWDVLPNVKTELKLSADEDSTTVDASHLKSVERNILSNNSTECSDTFDINSIGADVLSALQQDGVNNNVTTEAVGVTIGKKYTVKVNKVSHNKLSCIDIHACGITKMTELNLTVVRLRKQ